MKHELEKDAAAYLSEDVARQAAGLQTSESPHSLVKAMPTRVGGTKYLEVYTSNQVQSPDPQLQGTTRVLQRKTKSTLGMNRPCAALLGGYESHQDK